MKTKEEAVKQFINERFIGFHHDRPLEYGGCDCSHRRRVDHRKLINGTLLCVETDEFQHRGYDDIDEEHRYNDIAMVYGGKMVFIRYNPDPYRDGHGRRVDPVIELRFPVLERCMREQIKRIEDGENKDLLEVVHLFYDGAPNITVWSQYSFTNLIRIEMRQPVLHTAYSFRFVYPDLMLIKLK